MRITAPTMDQVKELIEYFSFDVPQEDIAIYRELIAEAGEDRNSLLIGDIGLPIFGPSRAPGYYPDEREDPLHAWYVRTDISLDCEGPLSGQSVAVKDNISIAGVQMMNGSRILEGYISEIDAPVITRLLQAGATITGKTNSENMCSVGTSVSNANGIIHNPHKRGFSAGGSSSGTGAAIGNGEADIGLGTDSGGSVRIPAAFCGCYGMKATHGLIPCTGVIGMEMTIEGVGPMTTTVEKNAKALQVLAGVDNMDPRQCNPIVDDYTKALGKGVSGLKIGVLREGFGLDCSEADVDQLVLETSKKFASLGASVEEISIPLHKQASIVNSAIFDEGMTQLMMMGNSFGTNHKGLYIPSLMEKQSTWRSRPNDLSKATKLALMTGHYLRENYAGTIYARAQNYGRIITQAYDKAFESYDILLMPTVPMKAQKIPELDCGLREYITRSFEMVPNTSPFNISGHPALAVPCGMRDGLPVSVQLVGKYWSEALLYRAAMALENVIDWKHC